MSMDGAQSSPETALPHASSEQRPNWRRRILVWLLPAVVATVSIWIYGSAGRYVETDNAYVQQDRIDVVAQISGDVRQVLVAENERVVAGQPVLMLDDAAQRIAVAGAEARLDSARAEIQSLKAAYREKTGEAAVAARAAELSVRELARQRQLADRKLIPESQLDSVQRSADIASGGAGTQAASRADERQTRRQG